MTKFEKDLLNAYRSRNYEQLLLMVTEKAKILMPSSAASLFDAWKDKDQEYFLVALLNAANIPIKVIEVTKGTLNRTLVDPRIVFREAVKENTGSIIIGHNHPSGNTEPSSEDIDLTKRLIEAGNVLGIRVIDHIIVSKLGYYSFAAEGKMH